MQEERRVRIRELLGSAVPGGVMGYRMVPMTLIVKVSVNSPFKKRVDYA
jgi:hypothetical protein